MFRFIHTADLHFDAPLKSLALKDEDLSELVGNATQRALERTINLCFEEDVDALLIAGDLYDGEEGKYFAGFAYGLFIQLGLGRNSGNNRMSQLF